MPPAITILNTIFTRMLIILVCLSLHPLFYEKNSCDIVHIFVFELLFRLVTYQFSNFIVESVKCLQLSCPNIGTKTLLSILAQTHQLVFVYFNILLRFVEDFSIGKIISFLLMVYWHSEEFICQVLASTGKFFACHLASRGVCEVFNVHIFYSLIEYFPVSMTWYV